MKLVYGFKKEWNPEKVCETSNKKSYYKIDGVYAGWDI